MFLRRLSKPQALERMTQAYFERLHEQVRVAPESQRKTRFLPLLHDGDDAPRSDAASAAERGGRERRA